MQCVYQSTERTSSGLAPSQKSCMLPSLVPPTHPEEDILFQWRLRRKMELARERPPSHQYSSVHGSSFNYQGHSLYCSTASGQTHKVRVMKGILIPCEHMVLKDLLNHLYMFFFTFIVFSNLYIFNQLNRHKDPATHTLSHHNQSPMRPMGHVPQKQVLPLSLPLLSPALHSLNFRLMLVCLPTCIFFVMSYRVPCSHPIPVSNREPHKG